MLSVIIPTRDSAADLQGLLAALVPAAMDGLVREVICADAGSVDPTAEICEDSGARLLAGGLVAAAQAAKSDWVLILPPGIQLRRDWAEALKAHLIRGKRPAVLPGAREPGLAARFRAVPTGLLAETARVAAQSETRDVADLVRALGGGAARL
jgi:cellulose synthase/poly-beta-1,6-N-acetylglucosamine synthase-like glycosyltransferase